MSDVGIQVTPEDRERLAKTKFGEWFDEFFDKKFEEAFAKKAEATRSSTKPAQGAPQSSADPPQQKAQPRRRSLLEMALTDTFGF